jgi:formylmethanofuran dehydrogenase subunit E
MVLEIRVNFVKQEKKREEKRREEKEKKRKLEEEGPRDFIYTKVRVGFQVVMGKHNVCNVCGLDIMNLGFGDFDF